MGRRAVDLSEHSFDPTFIRIERRIGAVEVYI